MSSLPEELWRRILELGVESSSSSSSLKFKDICSVSITCRLLNRLSNEDPIWSTLLSSDFPQTLNINSPSSTTTTTNFRRHPPNSSSPKSLYKLRFEKDREQKAWVHERAVLGTESLVNEHMGRLREIQLQFEEESKKMRATAAELSNLRKVRQASVALNVWQPEVIRSRQKQIVQHCSVFVDCRINVLEMELKLCKQQIAGLDRTHKDENRRLEAVKEQFSSINYHPLRNSNGSTSTFRDDCRTRGKKFKKAATES